MQQDDLFEHPGWEHVGSQYKPIEFFHDGNVYNRYDGDFLPCAKCGEMPRLWVFDNGSYATCVCFGKYEASPAQSESIMSVVNRCDGSVKSYNPDELRLAWNKWVDTGELQTNLPEGQW